jgi:hypothetical protein
MSTPQPTTNSGLNLLRALPLRLVALLQGHGEQRQRIATQQRISTRASADENVAAQQRQAQELTTLNEKTQASIAELRGEATKWKTAAESDISRRLGRPAPADSNEALLREMREQRAWARVRPLLDQVQPLTLDKAVGEHVMKALANGDDDTLFALRAELPAYVEARGASEIMPVILSVLDGKMAEVRPGVSDVLRERRELEVGMRRLLTGFAQAEYMVKQGDFSTVIPAWSPKDVDHIVQSRPVG